MGYRYSTLKSNEPCCLALKYGRLAGCRFCSLQPGGPSRLCLDMQKVYEGVTWLLDQDDTVIGFLKIVGVANEIIDEARTEFIDENFRSKLKAYEDIDWLFKNKIIDKAYDKAVDEYFREKRSE